MAAEAGYDPASALKDAAAYKAAPLPIRVTPPLSTSGALFAKASDAKLETGVRLELTVA